MFRCTRLVCFVVGRNKRRSREKAQADESTRSCEGSRQSVVKVRCLAVDRDGRSLRVKAQESDGKGGIDVRRPLRVILEGGVGLV